MNDIITKAQILFKDIVIDEGLQFDNEFGASIFENGLFYYVEHMPRCHREIWTEEHLIIFYVSKDYEPEWCSRTSRRGKLVFQPVPSLEHIPVTYEIIATCWLLSPGDHVDPKLLPEHHIIDPKHFKRILNLMVFS